MQVMPGCLRDEDDEVLEPSFTAKSNYLTAQQIFEDGGSPEENERWWVQLEEAPNYYLNDWGEVLNIKTRRYLKPKPMDKQGHLGFALLEPNGRLYLYLHRLMAMYFIDNPNNHPIVRHLDDDRNNNSLDNLAWGTMKDNHADAKRNGTAYYLTNEDREKHLRKLRRPIIAKDLSTNDHCEFGSISEAARYLGVHQANVMKVLRGERAHTCGYSFKYAR